jgi:hypothetical protein
MLPPSSGFNGGPDIETSVKMAGRKALIAACSLIFYFQRKIQSFISKDI